MKERLTILDWNVSERPREKYLSRGREALTDAELIAILLRSGNPQENAIDLARKLLAKCNYSLNDLANMPIEDLLKIKGIGNAKAISLQVAFELGQRRRAEIIENQKKIIYTEDVLEVMQHRLVGLKHEEFWVIYLNHSAKILKIERIGKGGLTSTTVDVRIIMKIALECFATGLILCHNHPSGDVLPSRSDIKLTESIKQAAETLKLNVIDHVIIAQNRFYSFANQCIL